MADNAKKISALDAITTLQSTDVIPVVDASDTKTMKATLQQVQDLGPGAGTVTSASIAAGAVTVGKTGYTAQDKIFYGSSSQNPSGAYTGAETALTSAARTLLEKTSTTAMRDFIQSNNRFTGYVAAPVGEIDSNGDVSPGFVFWDRQESADSGGVQIDVVDTTTGMYGAAFDAAPDQTTLGTTGGVEGTSGGQVNFACLGRPTFSIRSKGSLYVRQYTPPEVTVETEAHKALVPLIGSCAYALFSPSAATSTRNFRGGHSETFGQFLGIPWRNASTVVGTRWHGPSLHATGAFPTVTESGGSYTFTGGSGNLLAVALRLHDLGYDVPASITATAAAGGITTGSWYSPLDNAVLNLNTTFAASTIQTAMGTSGTDYGAGFSNSLGSAYASLSASAMTNAQSRYGSNRSTLTGMVVKGRSTTPQFLGGRGVSSLGFAAGTGSGYTLLPKYILYFEQPMCDTNYFIDAAAYSTDNATQHYPVIPYDVRRYTDRVEFRLVSGVNSTNYVSPTSTNAGVAVWITR